MNDFSNANQPMESQYNEWRGYAAADDWTGQHDLYEEAGLSRDEWHIVGWEIYPLGEHPLSVLASRLDEFNIPADTPFGERHSAWRQAIDEHGRLPVYRVHVSTPVERVFKRFGIRLLDGGLFADEVPVEIRGDRYPEEED